MDETQILQTVVQELALSMGALCCNAALFDLDAQTSTIVYEYTTVLTPSQGRRSDMAAFPELYEPLQRGECFQFCSLLPHPTRGRVASLVCPIQDEQGVMGDLWLVSPSFHAYAQADIRLMQQVANHCAIALRQARLYQVAQGQVEALARLNRLKDDFLSTVSHELRTPMSSIKMATQMLEVQFEQLTPLPEDAPKRQTTQRYLRILRDECQREIDLIDDMLTLSRLDAAVEPPMLSAVHLQDWIPAIADAFVDRMQSRQRTLTVTVPLGIPSCTTDSSYLERILTELLTNACKYTPAQETVAIAATATTHHATITVSNTGSYIPAVECDRIFETFYRIPNHDPWKHGGTGLGLALVKKLTAQIGGTIVVHSDPQLTTFTLTIPLHLQSHTV